MIYHECDERAHIVDSLANGDFEMTDDQLDNNTLEAHREWAGEAHQHLTAIFNRVTALLICGTIRQDDAAFLLRNANDAQEWLENFVPGQGKEPQQI